MMIKKWVAIRMWDDHKANGLQSWAAARNNVDPILLLQTGKQTDRQTGFV
jgi:hypothetical protein